MRYRKEGNGVGGARKETRASNGGGWRPRERKRREGRPGGAEEVWGMPKERLERGGEPRVRREEGERREGPERERKVSEGQKGRTASRGLWPVGLERG